MSGIDNGSFGKQCGTYTSIHFLRFTELEKKSVIMLWWTKLENAPYLMKNDIW